MDLHTLPAPIAYVRHLVDVEDDNRAKFDQLRVLAQNTLQFMAAILMNDCHRLELVEQLSTPIPKKRLAVGDFVTIVVEASEVLMPKIDDSYVPELVKLYGDQGKITRNRRTRLERIVVGRNRDAHTASLAQTRSWMDNLMCDMDAMLEELEFLRSYTVIATKNVEITPDKTATYLNGVRCHGTSERYVSVSLPIEQLVSRSEVILIKSDRSDSLSLRPWLLYLNGSVHSRGNWDELALLNSVSDHRLGHIGLISGAEYHPRNEWKAFTVYDSSSSQHASSISTVSSRFDTEASDAQHLEDGQLLFSAQLDESIAVHLKHLDNSYESIVVDPDVNRHGTEYFVSVRTPSRDIAIATVDASGTVWIYPRSLVRTADNDPVAQTRMHHVFNLLKYAETAEFPLEEALLEIGHISELTDWLSTLAHSFAD